MHVNGAPVTTCFLNLGLGPCESYIYIYMYTCIWMGGRLLLVEKLQCRKQGKLCRGKPALVCPRESNNKNIELVGRAPVGAPWPLRGPCGPPWALMGRSLMGQALMGCPGPLLAGPFMAPVGHFALSFSSAQWSNETYVWSTYIYMYIYMYIYGCIYLYSIHL